MLIRIPVPALNFCKKIWRDKMIARGLCPECCNPNGNQKYKLCFRCRIKRARKMELKRNQKI